MSSSKTRSFTYNVSRYRAPPDRTTDSLRGIRTAPRGRCGLKAFLMFPARRVKNCRQFRRVRIWCFFLLFLTLPLGAEEVTLWSKATDWGRVMVRQEGDIRKLIFTSDTGETEESRMMVGSPN